MKITNTLPPPKTQAVKLKDLPSGWYRSRTQPELLVYKTWSFSLQTEICLSFSAQEIGVAEAGDFFDDYETVPPASLTIQIP